MSFRLESVQQAQAVLELIRQKEPKTNEDLNEVMESKIGNQWIELQIDVRSCEFVKEPFLGITMQGHFVKFYANLLDSI